MASKKNKKRNARRRRALRETRLDPKLILKQTKPKTKVLAFDITGGRFRIEYNVRIAKRAIRNVIARRVRHTLIQDPATDSLAHALISWNLVKHGEPVPITLDAMKRESLGLLNIIVREMANDIGKQRGVAY
ncbi:MAG: hypothetical protein AABO41_10240 [Acidobacteriota bacterium]